MARYSAFNSMASTQEGAINRAVAMQAATMAALFEATAAPPAGHRVRTRAQADELLAAGDPATVDRMRQMGPYLAPGERAAVDRRAARAGGAPVFAVGGAVGGGPSVRQEGVL